MNAHPRITAAMLRFATWLCIILLAVLSLLPAEDMVRTGLAGRLEHFIAYAGSATVMIGGYGDRYGRIGAIGFYWVYGGILEYLQQFRRVGTSPSGTSPHRRLERFAACWLLLCLRGR